MMSQDGIEAIMVVFWGNEKAKNVLRRFFIRRIDAPISFFSKVRLLDETLKKKKRKLLLVGQS